MTSSNSAEDRLIHLAADNPDDYVIQMRYLDQKNRLTVRIVSPHQQSVFAGSPFRALCLSRGEPRIFHRDRCSRFALIPAADVEIPAPIIEIPAPD